MPAATTFKVIYLGQNALIDPTEGEWAADGASSLAGLTFNNLVNASTQTFSPGSYSSNDGVVSATQFQTYNQNSAFGNDTFFITDANGNTVQHTFDATASFSATLTYANGSTASASLVVMQDVNGHTWIAPPSTYSANAAMLEAQPIQAIKLNSVLGNTFGGLFYNREVLPNLKTVPCFAAGTLIRTEQGEMPVETLKTGDLVMTRDRGLQPIRWVGSRQLGASDLDQMPNLRPIRIAAGALGAATPEQDLLVSPQHRILVRSQIAQRMFSAPEVLVGAKHLVGLNGITVDESCDAVTYIHVMFDQHEVIFSNGAETESFYPGGEALKGISDAMREELFTLFPQLREHHLPHTARPVLSGRNGRQLVMRHVSNHKSLQQETA